MQAHIYRCEMDLALTYALRNPALARECCVAAMIQAVRMGRPDLAFRANALLAAIGGGL